MTDAVSPARWSEATQAELDRFGFSDPYDPRFVHATVFGTKMSGHPMRWPDIDFRTLAEVNPDVVGWVRMGGSPIDYPVVAAHLDGGHYLSHNFSGDESLHGAVSLAFGCGRRMGGRNTMLLAHTMLDWSMLRAVRALCEQDYLDAHATVDLMAADGTRWLKRHFDAGYEGLRLRFADNGELDGTAIWWRTLKGAMETSFVLTCCDVLVDVDYPAVAREHVVRGDAMTLVAYRRTRVIPGGAVQVGPDGAFEGFSTRRTADEVIYAGVAVVEPAVFSLESGDDNPLTLQNLLESCRGAGWRVGVHVVEGTSFHDMGSISALVRTGTALREVEGDLRTAGQATLW